MFTESIEPAVSAPSEEFQSRVPSHDQKLPPDFYCDLAKGNAFYPAVNDPPVPVLAAFGAENLHQCRLEGLWDFDRAAAENPHSVIRSYRNLTRTKKVPRWEDVIFQLGKRAFVCGDRRRIIGYAGSQGEAEALVREFASSYSEKVSGSGGNFQLIRKTTYGMECENVDLDADTVLDRSIFSLHYPEGAWDWHEGFMGKLAAQKHGLSIFEGAPGTGKTSYLRHLMGSLVESHRFYFIAPSNISILSEPNFIGFWAKERQVHTDHKLVVILEDADAALMARAADNRTQASTILNLSDGMLADFLQIQIICTMNCGMDDIDRAFLRPGRLLCHRLFERLDPLQAAKLAEAIGKTLPQARDYSLAEVFAGHNEAVMSRTPICFGGV